MIAAAVALFLGGRVLGPSATASRCGPLQVMRTGARSACLREFKLGGEQRSRVGLARRVEQRLGLALLDDVAVLHHQHAVRHRAHHRQVVADEEVAHAVAPLQLGQQRQHLLLHRHVERRGRLVEHQHLGPQHHRARDGDALALAAGELVRIALQHAGHALRAPTGRPRRASASTSRSRSRRAQLGRGAAPGPRRRSGRPSCAATARRTGPGTPPACAGACARSACAVGVVDALAADLHLAAGDVGCSASSAMPSVVLPEPDSPTMPSVSPRRSCSVASRTASKLALAEPALAGSGSSTLDLPRPAPAPARRRPPAAPRAAAGWRAACACRDAAGCAKTSPVSPISTSLPRSITPTRWREAAHQVQVVRDEQQRHAHLALQLVEQRRGSAPGSSRRARSSARRRSAAAAGRPAPSRSSRAGAGRPTAGAGRRRRGARARGCRCAPAARWRARAPRCGRSASCSSSTSPIWLPTVYSGFSAVIGSWKIMPMRAAADAAHLALALVHQVLAVEADRAARGGAHRPGAAPTAR